jgi:hypothetical protein
MTAPRIFAADRQQAGDPIHRGSMNPKSIHLRGWGSRATFGLTLGFFVAACATSGAGNDAIPGSGATGKTPGGSTTDGSSGGQPGSQTDDSGSSSSDDGSAAGDDGSVPGDDGTSGDDGSAGDDGDDQDAAAGSCAATCTSGCCDSSGNCQAGTDDGMCGAGGATCSDCTTSGGKCQSGSCASTFTCTTTLPSPAPVCDSKHQYCLCTSNAQCNSNGLNVVNKGGCHSGKCSGTACTGGQNTDSAGCSIVGPTCNLGGNQGCPAKTTCEMNHGGCGGQVQCCWCTSDAACPVSGKCVDDATQKQCDGLGPCTGSGTDVDGMHCQLASPGIPMCTAQ